MSSFSRVWRVDFQRRTSKIYLGFLGFLHAAAWVFALRIFWPQQELALFNNALWLGVVAVVCITAVLSIALMRAWRQEQRIHGAHLGEQEGHWCVELPHRNQPHQPCAATLQRSRVWRYLVVLDFLVTHGDIKKHERVVIFTDSVSASEFRRLCVRMRYGLHLQNGLKPSMFNHGEFF